MDPGPRWISSTDLAEYAYCPRAGYYRRRHPDARPSGPALAGTAYHARVLGRERREEERPAVYWVGLLVGALLAGAGLLALVRP